MKTKIVGLLVLILATTTQCVAQKTYTVEAENNDISNNLDLKAVATAFGESKNLEDFERRINDYDSGISNLDLNNDGQVDYLRVVEKMENNTHVVVIQSVLDKEVYQDVATIVVDKDQNSNTSVQVIGDPYIYGPNYIIEPAYYYTPSIFSFFWGSGYYSWHSPYYWGYYPEYYHHHSPFTLNIYLSNIYGHINHDHRYYYSNTLRNQYARDIHASLSRNDYATMHPERTFSSRNDNVRNKRDFEFNRNGAVRNGATRPGYQQNSTETTRPSRNYNNSNGTRNSQSNGWNQANPANNSSRDNHYQNRTNPYDSGNRNNSGLQNNNRNQNNSTTPNYTTPPTNYNRNLDGNNNNRVTQPSIRNDNGNQNNTIHRDNTNRPNTQQTQPKPVERKPVVSQPIVKEPRHDTRDNSTKNDERK